MVCLKCHKQFPMWALVNGVRKNLCHRKYCMVCSPFGKHNTKILHIAKPTIDKRQLTNIRSNAKKSTLLGMSLGKATAQLKKQIMFELANRLGLTQCHRCGQKIISVTDFSIDHKIDWLNSETPKKLFFDYNNIAFSHLYCNISAGGRTPGKHGVCRKYQSGCRCSLCTSAHRKSMRSWRKSRKDRGYVRKS